MKKLVALLLAVMMLSAMALAEAPEGYPAVVEGTDSECALSSVKGIYYK